MTKKNNQRSAGMVGTERRLDTLANKIGITPEAMEKIKEEALVQEYITPLFQNEDEPEEIPSSYEIESTIIDSNVSQAIPNDLQEIGKSSSFQQYTERNKETIIEKNLKDRNASLGIQDDLRITGKTPAPQQYTEQKKDAIESEIKNKTDKEKVATITFSPLPSKSSIEQNIDSQTFSTKPSLNNQKGQSFTYRLKTAEVEPFNDIMLLKRSNSPSETLRGIFERVLRDYEDAIREEAAWNIELDKIINDPDVKDINTIYDMEDETFRKQRLARMGLFTPPQRTRREGIGKAIGCTIGPELVELVELLMIALGITKAAPAYQWIMNVFVADYADIIAQKTEKIKQAKYLFSREK